MLAHSLSMHVVLFILSEALHAPRTLVLPNISCEGNRR